MFILGETRLNIPHKYSGLSVITRGDYFRNGENQRPCSQEENKEEVEKTTVDAVKDVPVETNRLGKLRPEGP